MATKAPISVSKSVQGAAPKPPQTKTGVSSNAATTSPKTHRRSRSGCFTCRLRRKKCDEGKNSCKACKHLGLKCEYKRPIWWSNNEQRKMQKEKIKNIIKQTKLSEKTTAPGTKGMETPPGLTHSLPTSATYSEGTGQTRAASEESQYSIDAYDFNQAPHHHAQGHDAYDLYPPQVFTPQFDSHPYSQAYPPTTYEVDIKTERQTYVNDVPTRRDSSTSSFSTFHPPAAPGVLPTLHEDPWAQEDIYAGHDENIFAGPDEEGLNFDFFDFSHGPAHVNAEQEAVIQVDDCDKDLLEHFIENVLRLIFPILEVNQHGSARSEVILPALQSNKCYLHCCLSIAAIHLKSTRGIQSEQIDSDIVRHRYAAISELCEALGRDINHIQILEATLGMIFFQCSVGRPDDSLPDIPWHQHFQAAVNLVDRLQLADFSPYVNAPDMHPTFNMTLTSWIDILGATMIGRAPQFANLYREKHLSQSTSGLCELMGCEDRMMYLISEIACLEALKIGNVLGNQQLCEHITLLGQQMDLTEPGPGAVELPYSASGAIRPKQLSRNMTSIFRKAARIWLCSLVPGQTKNALVNPINQFVELLQYIPSGPDGFDRSLVWPLLVVGAQCTPESTFRSTFAARCASLGEQAEFGSFGRMSRLLQEVWVQSDEMGLVAGAEHHGLNVHWRDVMQQKGWEFLLI